MSDFLRVTRFLIPLPIVRQTVNFLRQVGRHGNEGLVLWCGRVDRDEASVERVVIPDQRPIRVADGICVTVGSQALHDLNVLLYENQMRLIAQVHSHAEDAYHSETDDRFSVVTTLGALSIVVPFFSANGIVLNECAIYQLCDSRWHEFSAIQKSALIKVI